MTQSLKQKMGMRKRKRTILKTAVKFETDALDPSLPFVFDLPLPGGLVLVDSREALEEFGGQVADVTLIGMDTETRPSTFRTHLKRKTALLQICARFASGDERVYIIDLMYLSEHGLMDILNQYLSILMGNESVIKIGHGLRQDFAEMFASYPVLTAVRNVRCVIETNSIHRLLDSNEKKMVSLKKLTKHYLHLNLVKAQTCSDWESRPLSDAQLHYSACDSLVLLRLYDVMMYECIDTIGKADFTEITFNIVEGTDGSSTDVFVDRIPKEFNKSNFLISEEESVGSASVENHSGDLKRLRSL